MTDISTLQLSDFIESSVAVLFVVRNVTTDGDVDVGDIADQGFSTSDQYPMANEYADSGGRDDIENHRFQKMSDTRTTADSESLLFSWTIAEGVGDIIGTISDMSIVGIAEDFNDRILFRPVAAVVHAYIP